MSLVFSFMFLPFSFFFLCTSLSISTILTPLSNKDFNFHSGIIKVCFEVSMYCILFSYSTSTYITVSPLPPPSIKYILERVPCISTFVNKTFNVFMFFSSFSWYLAGFFYKSLFILVSCSGKRFSILFYCLPPSIPQYCLPLSSLYSIVYHPLPPLSCLLSTPLYTPSLLSTVYHPLPPLSFLLSTTISPSLSCLLSTTLSPSRVSCVWPSC